MNNIDNIVEEVIKQMTDYGLSTATINMQYYGILKPILNLHHKHGLSAYSAKLVSDFLENYERRLETNAVTYSHLTTVRRTIQFLSSCANTGIVDFSYRKKSIKIAPSDYYLQLVDECLQGINAGNKGHKQNIGIYMKHFFCFMERNVPQDASITDEIVRKFIIEACSKYEGSIGYIMRAVRELVAFLRTKGLMEGNVDYRAFTPKAPRTKMLMPYSAQEIEALLSVTDSTQIGMRNKAMLLLGYGDGLRAIDIIRLTLDDIDWRKGELRIVQSKTAKPVQLTMNPTTMNAVADYILKARPKSSLKTVFLTVSPPYRPLASSSRLSVMMKELSEKSGVAIIPKRAFHGLRRSFAINLAEADVPLTTISQMLGHTDFSSDRQYLTFNKEQTNFCAMDFRLVPITAGIYFSDNMQIGGAQ